MTSAWRPWENHCCPLRTVWSELPHICLGGMKSHEEGRVTVLGMCCCPPTAVPGLLVCFGLVTLPVSLMCLLLSSVRPCDHSQTSLLSWEILHKTLSHFDCGFANAHEQNRSIGECYRLSSLICAFYGSLNCTSLVIVYFSVCVPMCACVHAHACVHVCACLCAHVWRPVVFLNHSFILHLIFVRQGSHTKPVTY